MKAFQKINQLNEKLTIDITVYIWVNLFKITVNFS